MTAERDPRAVEAGPAIGQTPQVRNYRARTGNDETVVGEELSDRQGRRDGPQTTPPPVGDPEAKQAAIVSGALTRRRNPRDRR